MVQEVFLQQYVRTHQLCTINSTSREEVFFVPQNSGSDEVTLVAKELLVNELLVPPKTNMEPENGPLEKEIPIGNHHFQVPC